MDRDACVANLNQILDRAQSAGVPVEVDMEESGLVSDTLKLFREAAHRHPQTRLAIQASLRRTPLDLEALAALKPRIRLVKGAYSEPVEVAQQGRAEIKAQFKFLTDWLFQHGSRPRVRHPRRRTDHLRARGRRSGGQGAARSSRSSCYMASAATSRRSWPTAATGFASTSPTGPAGIPTSRDAWPNAPRTCCSSCAP